jgi:ribose-phosphate pyrophosphokinase
VASRYREVSEKEGEAEHVECLTGVDFRFSDSETCVRLDRDVGGSDVFVFQSLCDPSRDATVDQNYMALLIAARTFREWGANHVTAVVPYLAYARQDKPTRLKREPTTAKLMADFASAAGIDRVVTWHPHQEHIHGFYGKIPVDVMDAVALFAEEWREFEGREDAVAIAPDAGATKFVTYFGQALQLPCAMATKHRPEPEEVDVSEIIGDFRGKTTAIVLDDIIGSGGTVHALVQKLVGEKGVEEVYLGVSHNLCMEDALGRLAQLHTRYALQKVVVTDSVPQTVAFTALPFVSVRSLSDRLARTVHRIHYSQPVSDLGDAVE